LLRKDLRLHQLISWRQLLDRGFVNPFSEVSVSESPTNPAACEDVYVRELRFPCLGCVFVCSVWCAAPFSPGLNFSSGPVLRVGSCLASAIVHVGTVVVFPQIALWTTGGRTNSLGMFVTAGKF